MARIGNNFPIAYPPPISDVAPIVASTLILPPLMLERIGKFTIARISELILAVI